MATRHPILAIGLGAVALVSTITYTIRPAQAAGLLPDSAANCAPEQYPPAGSARSNPSIPYQIPFRGTLDGGTLTVGNTVKAILGPADATLCGYLTLPSEQGFVANDEVDITNNPVPLSIAIPGLTLLTAYLELEGNMTASISRTPAANGGLNLDLYATFKGTIIGDATILGGITLPVPQLFGCTTAAGDQDLVGDSQSDLTALKATGYNFFEPIHFTTATSAAPGEKGITGKPVTGPVTGGTTEVVANDFPYPQLFGNTAQTTNPAPPPNPGCNATFVSLFNSQLGLPQPPGNAMFTAPADFSINVTA